MDVDTLASDSYDVIHDDKYPVTWMIEKFNESLLQIATLLRIPGLQVTKPVSVAAGSSSVLLPKNYLHDLYSITSETYPGGLIILPNKKDFTDITGTETDTEGPVEIVVIDNKSLLLWPSPTEAETLSLNFYCKPVTLEAGDDFPDYIPETFLRGIFQSYALKEAYNRIEDGVDGKSINTDKYTNLYAIALSGLISLFPDAPKSRPQVRRKVAFF